MWEGPGGAGFLNISPFGHVKYIEMLKDHWPFLRMYESVGRVLARAKLHGV